MKTNSVEIAFEFVLMFLLRNIPFENVFLYFNRNTSTLLNWIESNFKENFAENSNSNKQSRTDKRIT